MGVVTIVCRGLLLALGVIANIGYYVTVLKTKHLLQSQCE